MMLNLKASDAHIDLVEAIDDDVERLTGDRTKLHAQLHSIGSDGK
jgi:hypothetical protein